ncbi:MAG: glyoxylase-like metal-dependent hydrolase (beta-lactamase superfamily II) [Lentimonas sp.]|jgi:glyoxylase-like metal-dependent hydrolase (beta-lactamase superfamily II)
MKKTKLYLNHAGYCLAKENHAIKGGRKINVQFHALWGLIQHPENGYILFDTGYTSRFFEATKRFPNKIYALITKVKISPEEEVVTQLKKHGVEPKDIKHIIISHFHGDHIGGLKDFPNATFYCSSKALKHTINKHSLFAFSKGILKSLLPKNFEERTIQIDKHCEKLHDPIFGHKYDLFSDNSIYVYSLPGHAAGQIGIQLETEKKIYFLIADASWYRRSFENNILPNSIVKLFFHSWSDFKDSLEKIHHFYLQNPNVEIVPTHCIETTSKLIRTKITMDVL